MSTAVRGAQDVAKILLSLLIPEAILECHLLAFSLITTLEMDCCVVTSQAWKQRDKVDLFSPFQWMSFLFSRREAALRPCEKSNYVRGGLVMWDRERGCQCQKKRWEWTWVEETRKKVKWEKKAFMTSEGQMRSSIKHQFRWPSKRSI